MKFPRLGEPARIGNLELRNRMVMAPMVLGYASSDCCVTERQIDYYLERARGGVGLIISEAVYGNPGGHPFRLHIWDDKFIPGLKELTMAIHQAKAKIVIQINMSRGRHDEVTPLSASGVPDPITGVRPKVAKIEQIKEIVNAYGDAVRRAREADFDGVEVHGGGGYFLAEFLSPLTNKRTDEYGGDYSGRAKLALELVATAKEKAGQDFPVLFKFANERVEGGFSLQDAIAIGHLLEKAGVEAIEVVSGNHAWSLPWMFPPMELPRGVNVDFASEIKRALKVPIIVTGRINNPNLAEDILQQGKADFIGLGRALIADPEFPKKVIGGKPEDIRQCLACNGCVEAIMNKQPATCAVNVAVGKEKKFKIKLAKRRKKILVIGGGVAGMEFARVAGLRGHRVTLWEKSRCLGGQVKVACKPPYKEELATITDFLINQMKKLEIRVELNMEGKVASVVNFGAETVVIATGASPLTPRIPGIEKDNVITAIDVLSGAEVGQSVLVIGGGSVGCETAEFIASKSRNVTIIEKVEDVAVDMPIFSRLLMLKHLEDLNVKLLTKVEVKEITSSGIIATNRQGQAVTLMANSIVFAMGACSERGLIDALRGKVKELYEIGDCVKPGKIYDAIHHGAEAAYEI